MGADPVQTVSLRHAVATGAVAHAVDDRLGHEHAVIWPPREHLMRVEVVASGPDGVLKQMGGRHGLDRIDHLLVVGVVVAAPLEIAVVARVVERGRVVVTPPSGRVAGQHVLAQGVPGLPSDFGEK